MAGRNSRPSAAARPSAASRALRIGIFIAMVVLFVQAADDDGSLSADAYDETPDEFWDDDWAGVGEYAADGASDEEFEDGMDAFCELDIDEPDSETQRASDTGAASSSSTSQSPLQDDTRLAAGQLAAFLRGWLEFGLPQSELATIFGLTIKEVKGVKQRCRARRLAPEPTSSLGGPLPPDLPDRHVLEAQWLDRELWSMPVSAALIALAASLGVSVRQLRRHCQRVGFSPRHPVPVEKVRDALAWLIMRPWCNRLGPNFATTRLRTQFGWHVRPDLVRQLLSDLDPTGSARHMRARRRRVRPTYSVGGPRSLSHWDAHEKLAHTWGIWFHGGLDGASRFVLALQARDNKRSTTVCDIFVNACRVHGWSSRARWDKGKENLLAVREQVNRF
tara:strand:+ start:262 stop:1434 length:1173 start_codon:yes stop_codon:yes gene_type:complete